MSARQPPVPWRPSVCRQNGFHDGSNVRTPRAARTTRAGGVGVRPGRTASECRHPPSASSHAMLLRKRGPESRIEAPRFRGGRLTPCRRKSILRRSAEGGAVAGPRAVRTAVGYRLSWPMTADQRLDARGRHASQLRREGGLRASGSGGGALTRPHTRPHTTAAQAAVQRQTETVAPTGPRRNAGRFRTRPEAAEALLLQRIRGLCAACCREARFAPIWCGPHTDRTRDRPATAHARSAS